MRKMISFKIENLPDKQRKIVDDWANGQANIQQSLANLIMHVVEFTGNADVMDFVVQRKLHTVLNDAQLTRPEPLKVEEVKMGLVIEEPVSVQNVEQATDPIAKASKLFEEE